MSNLRSIVVLGVTTWAFVVCFAVWVMFGAIGIPIKNELGLNGVEFGMLTSTPVLTGALFRLPLGIWMLIAAPLVPAPHTESSTLLREEAHGRTDTGWRFRPGGKADIGRMSRLLMTRRRNSWARAV